MLLETRSEEPRGPGEAGGTPPSSLEHPEDAVGLGEAPVDQERVCLPGPEQGGGQQHREDTLSGAHFPLSAQTAGQAGAPAHPRGIRFDWLLGKGAQGG